MAALPYVGKSVDQQLDFPVAPRNGLTIRGNVFTKGSTARIPATALGSLWGGASWPEFGVVNAGKLTFDYYPNTKELRGFVQNGAGTGIARTVIAISQLNHQVLGSTVSNASTGAFTLRLECSKDTKVTVIAIPADGDMRNVVAYRDIVPVNPL
jgi:hypothetical protein